MTADTNCSMHMGSLLLQAPLPLQFKYKKEPGMLSYVSIVDLTF